VLESKISEAKPEWFSTTANEANQLQTDSIFSPSYGYRRKLELVNLPCLRYQGIPFCCTVLPHGISEFGFQYFPKLFQM
jgi:hypothetical protein